MAGYYHPGFKDDMYHVCDNCNIEDGRPTHYWKEKDFDLCDVCITKMFIEFIDPSLKGKETLEVVRTSISEETRTEIFNRDGNKCLICGTSDNLSVDHIIPFSRGGKTEKDNLQTLCRPCNSRKGNR